MGEMRESGVALDQPVRRRAAERFANLGDRLARSLPGTLATRPELGDHEGLETEAAPIDEEMASWYQVVPRFPLARSGYACDAVDEHIAGLEQELAELDEELAQLRAQVPAQDEVTVEIQRLGEQTSSILLAAHDRARETAQAAQEQAERCLADAAAEALSITEAANKKRSDMEADTRRLADRRKQLLTDLETLAGTLSSVAREASERLTG